MHARKTPFAKFKSDSVRRLVMVATAVVGFAFCATSPLRAASNVTFTTPVNVSNDGLGTVPQIVVDSSGNIDIAFADAKSITQCVLALPCPWTGSLKFIRSTDGGKTFSPAVVLAPSGAGPFRMVLESDCTIDIAYFANSDVFFAQSADCGKTFAPANVTQTGNMSSGTAMQMVLNQGVVQIAWQVGVEIPDVPSIYYAQGSAKSGFTKASILVTQINGVMALFGMALSKATADILWWAGEFHFLIDLSLNGGQPTTIDGGSIGSGPVMSADSAGNLNVAWGQRDVGGNNVIQFVRANGQTGTFGTVQTLAVGQGPGIATDPQGNIGMAWSGMQFSRSTDGGNTFSKPTTVNSGPSGAVDLSPQVVLPNSSSAGIAWGQGSDLWFNSSSDSGSTFSSAVNITNNKSSPTALQMITDSAGDLLMVWSGNDANGHDVFFARGSSNFTISSAPSVQTVLPGGTAKFTLTLTASGGFSSAVNLSCGTLPSGADCVFNPSSITPSASGAQSTLTVTIPPTLPAGNLSVPITAATGSIMETQNVQVAVGGLRGSVSPASGTITVGGFANFAVSLMSSGGFGGQVSLLCSGLPSGLGCTFHPALVTLPANGTANSGLVVNVSAKPSISTTERPPANRPLFPSRNLPQMGLGLVLLAAALFCFGVILRPRLPRTEESSFRPSGITFRSTSYAGLSAFVLALVLAAGLISCGGTTSKSTSSSGGGTTGTASGTGGTGGMGGTGGTSGSGGSSTGSITTQITVQAQVAGTTVADVGTISITVP